jgi:1-acyl-sn-glycerol-3-phosphate acyltransferase
MDKHPQGVPGNIFISVFRGGRLALHVFYGMLLAVFYPHLKQTRQRRIVQSWSRGLLSILNISIRIEGPQYAHGGGSCMTVANHVSWLDIFVLNAIHPSLFIAKSEVAAWPIVGWLCRRSGTIFIERALRQNTSQINRRLGLLLQQGARIALFPEGTTTDGAEVGHFHSSLLQSVIDADAKLAPLALRYQNENNEFSCIAAFTGDMTLVQSIWQILRCPRLNVRVVFTPELMSGNTNRRMLARAAQEAIAKELQAIGDEHAGEHPPAHVFTQTLLSSQSAYALLIDTQLQQLHK